MRNDVHVIAEGLRTTIDQVERLYTNLPQKLLYMRRQHLTNNPHEYTTDEVTWLDYFHNAYVYKYRLALIHIESIWALQPSNHNEGLSLEAILSNMYDQVSINDQEITLICSLTEDFLVHASTFLDFYLIYLYRFFHIKQEMKFERVLKDLDQTPQHLTAKKASISAYLQTVSSFTKGQTTEARWGTMIHYFRNSIAHRDRVLPQPHLSPPKTLTEQLMPRVPTTTLAAFCQDIANGMFTLLIETSPLLYDIPYRAGPLSSAYPSSPTF